MSNGVEDSPVIFGSERDEEMLERGIYPITLTRADRYVNEVSVDSVIYDSLSTVWKRARAIGFLM